MEDVNMTEETPNNPSRRNFIKGVIAAGAAVSSASYLFRTNASGQAASAPGSVERLFSLSVNGQERRVDVLKHSVRTKKIVTIEGLASADGTLHPVQQGVVDEQGFQCAFCMPGFVMSAVGYLK